MTVALRRRPLARVVQGIVQAGAGCWLDPSDTTTLYQDAAGTIPVTAVEQPVGLVLDKSQGLMLGPELVSNGTFDSNLDGWTLDSGWSVINGKAVYTSNTGRNISQVVPTKIGGVYLITYDVVEIVTSGVGVYSPQSLNLTAVSTYHTTVGTKTAVLISNSANSTLYFRNSSSGAPLISIDNISVREIYGYHAAQSVTASRPTLSARKNILLATETLATQSVTTLAAQYTLSFTGTGSVTLSGTATGTLTGTGVNDRVSLTVTPTAGTLTLTVSGNVTKAQLELGTVAGPYQRVNTATDYDTDERYFPAYLRFDGVDDYLNLQYMRLYAGGEMSIIAARNAVSQATNTYIISERSTTDADPKYFPYRQLASGGNMDAYISDDAAAVVLDTAGSAFGGAADKVIRSVVDTGSNLKLYKNGILAADDNYTRAGTLTLNNTTLGASVSTTTSNYASMKLYGLLITKSALSDAQRIQCERYLGRKSGVQL